MLLCADCADRLKARVDRHNAKLTPPVPAAQALPPKKPEEPPKTLPAKPKKQKAAPNPKKKKRKWILISVAVLLALEVIGGIMLILLRDPPSTDPNPDMVVLPEFTVPRDGIIAAGGLHTAALLQDGTVVSTQIPAGSKYRSGQCEVSGWTDVVAIAAGQTHVLGLKADGTVLAAGENASGACDVGEWKSK